MTNRKIRAFQHIMESESFDIIKEILPKEWLIREYRPDYGIDLSIEIFKYIDAEKRKAETLGEHLFIQVKSVEKLKVQKIKVKSRDNVAKYKLKEKEEFIEIDVIKHQLETSELMQLKKYIYSNNIDIYKLKLSIEEMWRRLNILGRNYEELCREWFLPTYMSTYLSYNK